MGTPERVVDGPLAEVEAAERESAISHAIATVLRGFARGRDIRAMWV
ncbi:hypothetical protein ABIA39_003155 [Nocardia sp. GAS34]